MIAGYGATIFLGATLNGINGGVANEAKGNSYTNGYVGGATGGAIQATCSKTPAETIIGGGVGVTVGTTVTDVMNNWDPDSTDSTAQEIATKEILFLWGMLNLGQDIFIAQIVNLTFHLEK